MPAALAISSTGASCMPRSSNSARVTWTRSRSRVRGDGSRRHDERKCDSRSQRWLGCRVRGGEGAPPKVPRLQRRVLSAIRAFTSPLLPDDYLELINPLWSTRELRGRIEEIDARRPTPRRSSSGRATSGRATSRASTCASASTSNGRRHWRAYSLTSDPGRPDGFISITSRTSTRAWSRPTSCGRGGRAASSSLGGVEGEFVLPDPLPEKLLFISAGSGITPIMSMLRSLDHRGRARRRPAHPLRAHAGRRDLRRAAARDGGAERGLPPARAATPARWGASTPARPRRAVPGLERARGVHLRARRAARRARRALGGARPTATACTWSASSRSSARPRRARAGRSSSSRATARRESDGSKPILVAGEDAGLTLPFGCREGICHTCVGELQVGRDPRPAHRQGLGLARARWSAPASTPPRAQSRSNCERTRAWTPTHREPAPPPDARADRGDRQGVRRSSTRRSSTTSASATPPTSAGSSSCTGGSRCWAASAARRLALPPLWAAGTATLSRPRSSRTWRSATTSCTASGTG